MSDTVARVSLEEQIRRVVSDQLGVDAAELVADASILDDLGADSLDVVELVMALEEAFDIEVPDDHVEQMRTMGEIKHYVTKRLAPFAGIAGHEGVDAKTRDEKRESQRSKKPRSHRRPGCLACGLLLLGSGRDGSRHLQQRR